MIKLRHIKSAGWRHAHRHELPTVLELLTYALCLLAFALIFREYDGYRIRIAAEDAIKQNLRILAACNAGKGLGHYVDRDGSMWEVICSFSERRVRT